MMGRGAGDSGAATWALATALVIVPCALLSVLVHIHADTGADAGLHVPAHGQDDDRAVEAGPGEIAPVVVDAERSTVVAVTGKAGLLRFLGHEHAILAKSWTAEASYDPARPEATSLEVVVDAGELEIDSPEAREAAGLDPDGPSGDDLREIADKMRGPEYLAVEQHPEIRFTSSSVRVDDDGADDGPRQLEVSGTLTIRDRSRRVSAPLRVETVKEGWRVSGTLEIELRDFGMEPESIGGVVKVANELDIRVDVHASPVPLE